MLKNLRPIAFVIASTDHGSMLVNRYDYHATDLGSYGVGYQLLNASSFDISEVEFALELLLSRKKNFGDGVVAIDCGANLGVHTIEWARVMHGWGKVIAVEAQERIYYALAGNIAMNNCFNAHAVHAAVGSDDGELLVPKVNYFLPSSFGSLELKKNQNNEFIGQDIDYTQKNCIAIRQICIDKMSLERLDLIKFDIEGMEMEALIGAKYSIEKHRPLLIVEKIKSNVDAITNFLAPFNYQIFPAGINLIAIHQDDPALSEIKSGR